MRLYKKTMKAFSLLNHTPFDGCLLVFNANAQDWRVKAVDFKRRHGIGFRIHNITGETKAERAARSPTSNLYITIKE